jgi:hypothetical protein
MQQVLGPESRRCVGLDLECLPPLGSRLSVVSRGIEREPEMKVYERRARVLGDQLSKTGKRRVGPASDRGSDSGFEGLRIFVEERGELSSRGRSIAAVVGPLCLP